MVQLSREEKEELLNLSSSAQVNKDFQVIKQNQSRLLNRCSIDRYIIFLSVSNSFIGHRLKTFKKIEGDNFKL